MTLTRTKRILVGIGSVVPVVYALIFVFLIFPIAMKVVNDPSELDPSAVTATFSVAAAIHVSMMILSLFMLVYFLVHLYRSDLDSGPKAIWALALFFGSVATLPVYFVIRFNRPKDPANEH